MMKPHVAAVLQKGWMRAGGACVGCFLSLYFVSFVVQKPLAFSVSLFMIITLAFYLGAQSKYGYFWCYMLGHTALIAMISVMNPYNTFPVHIAFYRAAAVTIGVVSSIVINVILWPEYPEKDIKEVVPQKNTADDNDMEAEYFYYTLFRTKHSIHIPTLQYATKGGLGILMVF